MAPKLIDMQELAGGWKFILIERIELRQDIAPHVLRLLIYSTKDAIKQQLQKAVSHMQQCPWGSADTERNDKKS